MIGAIIGDIVGSRFEWDNIKTKAFELFTPDCSFTDDSVMTLAVAQAILNSGGDLDALEREAVACMRAKATTWTVQRTNRDLIEARHSDEGL